MGSSRTEIIGPLACVGEILIDFVARETGVEIWEAETFTRAPGGAVANTAIALSRLGAPTRFVSKVGRDPFGRYLRRFLEAEGVDIRFLFESDEHDTGLVFVALDDERVPRYSFFGNPSADMMLEAGEVGPAVLEGASFLHTGTVSMAGAAAREAVDKLIGLAAETGVLFSFDPNLRLHLWKDHDALRRTTLEAVRRSALVKLNRDELGFLLGEVGTEKGAAELMSMGPEVVVITSGPEGAYHVCPGGDGFSPGFEVEVLDTTGCGDGFMAGLLASLHGTGVWPPGADELGRAARFANAAGAVVATRVGAVAALTGRAPVEELLNRHGF